MNSGFGGLAPTYKFFEYDFNSSEASTAGAFGVSKLNNGLFITGGKIAMENIAAMKILAVNATFTWWVIDEQNNTFILTESGHAGVVVALPYGTYDINDFQDNLVTALNTASLSGYTYSTSYNKNTLQLTIYNDHATSSPFSLKFGGDVNDDGFTNMRFVMGFNGGTITSTGFITHGVLTTNYGNYITSPNVVNLSGPNYLYVCSNEIGGEFDLYLPKGNAVTQGNAGPQMACVDIPVGHGASFTWTESETSKWFDVGNLKQMQQLDIYFTLGGNPKLLDLRGSEFRVKLGLMQNRSSISQYSSGPAGGRMTKI